MPAKRRIAIVFKSTDDEPMGKGNGWGYSVEMEGHDSARMKRPDEELDGVEVIARKCFLMIINVLRTAGAVHQVRDKPPSGGGQG